MTTENRTETRKRSRWHDKSPTVSSACSENATTDSLSDEHALTSLLASAQRNEQKKQKNKIDESRKKKNHFSSKPGPSDKNPPSVDFNSRSNSAVRDQNYRNNEKGKIEECDYPDSSTDKAGAITNENKQKPNFGLSGVLATDNIYNGVLLKFKEPPEARVPNTRWRLYVFKKNIGVKDKETEGNLLEVLHISRQSAYLFGRERKVADVPVDHPSLSKQHCVLQYRALPDKNTKEQKVRCKPYLMDLGSSNGSFINSVRLEEARYYELRKGDVITLGASSREYVLLTENTTAS